METVSRSCRPKHQVLILRCYPKYQKGVQDVKPNSSELSYLLYYASTRRKKLTKVGAFLAKRAARDVGRHKLGNVQVTLRILTALIEKVPRDLPIYAGSVLTVIEIVLRSSDISILEDSVSTFEALCRHQDMAVLAAGQNYASQYQLVVRAYAEFAAPHTATNAKNALSLPMAIRRQSAALRALKAVVSSEGLTVDGPALLNAVLPVILQNLHNDDENWLSSLRSGLLDSEKDDQNLARRRRISVATIQTIDNAEGDPALALQTTADADRKAELEMRLLALCCLERLIVNGGSRGQVRLATRSVLQFIVTNHPLKNNPREIVDGDWSTSLLDFMAQCCPVQARFVILVTAMELLLDTNPAEDLDHSITLTYLIGWLLKSPVNLIGLSVMDVLLGLLRFVLRVLRQPMNETQRRAQVGDEDKENYSEKSGNPILQSNVRIPGPRSNLISLLEQSIGDLATHIYYGDQIADMISTILSHLKASNLVPNAAASTTELQKDDLNSSLQPPTSHGETNAEAFTFSSSMAKVTALRAIKSILVVANLGKSLAVAGAESRNRVTISVWEGTQWLLRDSDTSVRYAYTDAFLSWLKLETNNGDFNAIDDAKDLSKSMLKRDTSDSADKFRTKLVLAAANQRDTVLRAGRSNFLPLLHLTIYDMAIELPTDESNVLVLHLLLANLIEHLGVNAARFGFPMILRLQDDLTTTANLQSPTALVNIGSLVHGYLWALTDKFNLEGTKPGLEIRNEIEARKQTGAWLQQIRLPPISLHNVVPRPETHEQRIDASSRRPIVTPFQDKEELIHQIEEAYRASTASPHSSQASPTRKFSVPISQAAPSSHRSHDLPAIYVQQMLSSWSRDTCLAAVENEKAKASSTSGSRAATSGMRSYLQINGNGDASSVDTASPKSALQVGLGFMGPTILQELRGRSVTNFTRTPNDRSSKESPVRVNELRRLLSVGRVASNGRLSPLRGLHTSSGSVHSTSTESMISGTFSVSDFAPSRSHSVREAQSRAGREEPETPVAADKRQNDAAYSPRQGDSDIPPVPPIPLSLAIPGGFSSDPQRSSTAGRPSTAPGSQEKPSAMARSAERPNKTTNQQRSLSSTGLRHATSGRNDEGAELYAFQGCDSASLIQRSTHIRPHGDVSNLLGDLLSAVDGTTNEGPSPYSMTGIGRPPY